MNQYSEAWHERWPHFQPAELLSPTQLTLFETKGVIPYSFRAIDKLEAFRGFLKTTVIVNHLGLHLRGARSLKEVFDTNTKTRGPSEEWGYSFHLWCAFDVNVPGLTPLEVKEAALRSRLWGGIGLYDTFTHIDDRDHIFGGPALWDYRTKK